MPTENVCSFDVDSCYERLKEDVLSFKEKGKDVLLCDFNARFGIGRSVKIDDVIVIIGEDKCNASGNKMFSSLN